MDFHAKGTTVSAKETFYIFIAILLPGSIFAAIVIFLAYLLKAGIFANAQITMS